jgi:sensor histidine kinase YesM
LQVLLTGLSNGIPQVTGKVLIFSQYADTVQYLHENIRLQHRRRAQERNEQELRLAASRSELKALRAQINPHFLFNALKGGSGATHGVDGYDHIGLINCCPCLLGFGCCAAII